MIEKRSHRVLKMRGNWYLLIKARDQCSTFFITLARDENKHNKNNIVFTFFLFICLLKNTARKMLYLLLI